MKRVLLHKLKFAVGSKFKTIDQCTNISSTLLNRPGDNAVLRFWVKHGSLHGAQFVAPGGGRYWADVNELIAQCLLHEFLKGSNFDERP